MEPYFFVKCIIGISMDWMKIGSALFIVAMLVFLVPRIKPMLENSPKGTNNDWLLVGVLLAGVAGFIWLLMKMV